MGVSARLKVRSGSWGVSVITSEEGSGGGIIKGMTGFRSLLGPSVTGTNSAVTVTTLGVTSVAPTAFWVTLVTSSTSAGSPAPVASWGGDVGAGSEGWVLHGGVGGGLVVVVGGDVVVGEFVGI